MDWSALSGVSDLGSLITGIASVITNGVQAKKQRESNEQMIRETNASNLEQVDKQNAAAAAEAEKQRAYESAPAQVSRLRSAGMSKAGALGTLNGAGGYTPAPVNAGQSQSPTQEYQPIDFSGVANALQGMAQLSEQRRVNDAVIKKTNTDERKSDMETKKLEIEKQEAELLHSSNVEVRDNFPKLQSYLSNMFWAPDMRDNKDLSSPEGFEDFTTYWRFLEKDNKQLYDIASRNSEMRSYVDNYLSYKFSDYMNELGFTTSLTSAKLLRQQVDEYLSKDNVSLRDKKTALELALTEFQQDYYKADITGNETIDSIISKFRMWSTTSLGQQTTSTLMSLGDDVIKSLLLRKPTFGGKK